MMGMFGRVNAWQIGKLKVVSKKVWRMVGLGQIFKHLITLNLIELSNHFRNIRKFDL